MRKQTFAGALIVICVMVQAKKPAPNTGGLPKPVVDLTAGTWKYKTTVMQAGETFLLTHSITIKDDGSVWTVTGHWETPDGPVTDIWTLDKGTLILRKESFKHFAKRGQPWKPVSINLEFTGNKVTGTITNGGGQESPFATDSGGPLFAGVGASELTIGRLPLADGYSATFRNWDIQYQKEKQLQLKVLGVERVTVPGGVFDCYKVELTSADGGSNKQIVWIAKDSRTPVKVSTVMGNIGGSIVTTELIQ